MTYLSVRRYCPLSLSKARQQVRGGFFYEYNLKMIAFPQKMIIDIPFQICDCTLRNHCETVCNRYSTKFKFKIIEKKNISLKNLIFTGLLIEKKNM